MHSFAMLYSGELYSRPFRAVHFVFFVLVLLCLLNNFNAVPIPDSNENTISIKNSDESVETTTASDLYVIRAIVYEIGVLTDVDNSTKDTTDRHEEINISFYNPSHDNGFLNFNNTTDSTIMTATSPEDTTTEDGD